MKSISLEMKSVGLLPTVHVAPEPELEPNIRFVDNVMVRLPRRAAEDIRRSIPFRLKEHLSAILFFTREDDEFFCRVAGSKFFDVIGCEASGKLFSDVLFRWPDLHHAIEGCAAAAFDGRISALTAFHSATGSNPRRFEIVFLPLKDASGAVPFGLGHVAFHAP